MPEPRTVTVVDGKYTVIIDVSAHGTFRALRHGEEWRDLTGDNLILALASELADERQKSATLLVALCRLSAFFDFSTPLDPGEYGIADPTLLNEAFAQALAAIAVAEGK